MSDQWQPIETAPRNGTAINVRFACGVELRAEHWEGEPRLGLSGGWAFDVTDHLDDIDFVVPAGDPTHWRPLPTPPREAS